LAELFYDLLRRERLSFFAFEAVADENAVKSFSEGDFRGEV